MMSPRRVVLFCLVAVAAVGCGGGSSSGSGPATTPAPQSDAPQNISPATPAAGARNTDWPLFGVRADRRNVHAAGANATRLRRIRINAPGTADSPGPMKNVPAEKLRSMLGITSVNYVEHDHSLAIVDRALETP